MAKAGKKAGKVSALEWISAAIGLVIVLLIVGTISRQAIADRGDPLPLLTVRLDSVVAAPQGRVATVTVSNASGHTAAAVQVEGVAGKGTPDEQVSSASIDYVPGHGEARAALVFDADAPPGPVRVRVTGYEHP
jgi:uncharacterized protein (TIGR02588 family)